MTIDKKKVYGIVDSWVYDNYNTHILTEDGFIDKMSIFNLALSGTNMPKGISDTDIVDEVDINISETEGDGNAREIQFAFDEEMLQMYVPKELREKIEFAVEYIISGFDKLQIAVSDIAMEFQVDREGVIVNAEKELKNVGSDFSADSRVVLLGCIGDVGNTVEQLKKSIIALANRIEAIPRDRKKRLFRTPIDKILADVRMGRVSVYDYIYGTVIYAEMNMKIGRKNAAINRMSEAISFLDEMIHDHKFERIEQWNDKKDRFWDENIKEEIVKLKESLEDIKNFNGEIQL